MTYNLPKVWSFLPKIDFSLDNVQDPVLYIFKLNLKEQYKNLSFFEALLDRDEIQKAKRFLSHPFKDTNRVSPFHCFLISRGMLKYLLASFLNLRAQELHFSYTLHGKPFLDPLHYKNCFFNISHSHHTTLIGLSPHHPIGIDVEYKKPDIDEKPLATRMFSKSEQEFLLALPQELQKDMFYHLWSRKEAVTKVDGQGVFQNFSELELPTLEQIPSPLNLEGRKEKALWLWDLPTLPQYSAAAAWRGKIKYIFCYELSTIF